MTCGSVDERSKIVNTKLDNSNSNIFHFVERRKRRRWLIFQFYALMRFHLIWSIFLSFGVEYVPYQSQQWTSYLFFNMCINCWKNLKLVVSRCSSKFVWLTSLSHYLLETSKGKASMHIYFSYAYSHVSRHSNTEL